MLAAAVNFIFLLANVLKKVTRIQKESEGVQQLQISQGSQFLHFSLKAVAFAGD